MESIAERDYVLVECDLAPLKALVENLEKEHELSIAKQPGICLTMVRAEDSIEKQEFYLGEVLTTECEVLCDGTVGYGICLGEEPERAYCIAAVDAVIGSRGQVPGCVQAFFEEHSARIQHRETVEFNHELKTRVDFKLFDEE
jgi:alpha-D-ribose 1-methylphosphonate 5-triphosphate synthase subunit PhnG